MTYYDVLNVPCDATEEEIKTAYRNMLKAFHPDYYTGDKAFAEDMTQRIVEAYSVLRDKDKRKRYDENIAPDSHFKQNNGGNQKPKSEAGRSNKSKNDDQKPKKQKRDLSGWAFFLGLAVLSVLFCYITIASQGEAPTWDEIYSAVQSQEAETHEEKQPRQIVYITENGTKYHREWCSTIAKSKKYTVFLTPELIKEYGPCSVCDPPLLFLGD